MAKEVKKTVAFQTLNSSVGVSERAESFFTSIDRNLEKYFIDKLKERQDELNDRLFSLKDFTLQTDLNKGQSAVSREDAEKRFTEILETEYKLELVTRELEIKEKIFNKYFK